MKLKLMLALLAVALGVAVYVGTVAATPPTDVTPTIFGVGTLARFDTKGKVGAWSALMKTTKASDMHVLSNRIAPGGSFGWHSHPGPSFVIITSGTATVYLGADPSCTPRRIPTGSGFVDRGLQTHLVRNEGTTDLVTVVVSFVPKGLQRRIDKPAPGNCAF